MTTEALLDNARSAPAGSGLKALSVALSVAVSVAVSAPELTAEAVEESIAEFSRKLLTLRCCHQQRGFRLALRRLPMLLSAPTQPDHKFVSWVPLFNSTAPLNGRLTIPARAVTALFPKKARRQRIQTADPSYHSPALLGLTNPK